MKKGFTLIELIVVVVILWTIASVIYGIVVGGGAINRVYHGFIVFGIIISLKFAWERLDGGKKCPRK